MGRNKLSQCRSGLGNRPMWFSECLQPWVVMKSMVVRPYRIKGAWKAAGLQCQNGTKSTLGESD